MGPTWGRQDPGGPHVDPMNFDIWVIPNSYKISDPKASEQEGQLLKQLNLTFTLCETEKEIIKNKKPKLINKYFLTPHDYFSRA